VRQRAEVLRRCAEALEENRYEFNALLVREIAKPWADADAEVSEAIDFLYYYANHAEELFDEERLVSVHGERNTLSYRPYGVATVIVPWNFPLAILTGMTAAALVTGNTVIVKPSEQSSVVAYEIVKLIKIAIDRKGASYPGLSGTINLLTGSGELIGNYLVEHPSVRLISFTGSEAVGRSIAAKAASANVRKQVIAEMGGKNAIIVDETADLDEVIPGVLHSAFGYAGQKCSACSRLIVTEGIYNKLKARLSEALKGLRVGDASDLSSDLSAVIDAESYQRINKIVAQASKSVTVPDGGYYISPVILETDDLESSLATEEIFGPVLVLIKARNLEHAVTISNNSRYGLTGGIYSRSPVNINYARKNLEVGNLYINRACTGAIVSRQAFGGLKNSSIGFKAGGPNYLLQFVQEQCVSENTMRKGFEA
jgi:RHH-type proline utilization regulon transcriptional repressor/proline dehydrogenase/delta 1-pyrroline-5-carboxylate dehydrogenase